MKDRQLERGLPKIEIVRRSSNAAYERFLRRQENFVHTQREIEIYGGVYTLTGSVFVLPEMIPIVETLHLADASELGLVNISFGSGMFSLHDAWFLNRFCGGPRLTVAYDYGHQLDVESFWVGEEVILDNLKIELPYIVVVNNFFGGSEITRLLKNGLKIGTVMAVSPYLLSDRLILKKIAKSVGEGLMERLLIFMPTSDRDIVAILVSEIKSENPAIDAKQETLKGNEPRPRSSQYFSTHNPIRVTIVRSSKAN